MTVPQRLSMVTLGVSDVGRSTTFYESLGVASVGSLPGHDHVLLDAGERARAVRPESLAEDVGVSPDGSGFRGVTIALNCDSRDEVDAVFAGWVSAGATAVKRPAAVFWGGYSSYVADLDGHLWEIAHNPFSPNDDDGRMQLPD